MISSRQLTPDQSSLVTAPLDARIFLEGPAGSGKTTTGVERLLHLMAQGIAADKILLLVPQRTLAAPYYEALRHPGVVTGGMVSVVTLGGLARRMVDLFWPLVAEAAGFDQPDRPPIFLTLETAQYYMAHLVAPLFSQGYFDTLVIDRNRLYSQILDNLSKSAAVGFPHTEIGDRLQGAAAGEAVQARVYKDAQLCAVRFREYCLQNNLLDFSLQLEIFLHHLWPDPVCQEYLTDAYRHLIVDNLEENPPAAADVLDAWLPRCDSALLIFDHDGGYRLFLGADPTTAIRLKDACSEHALLDDTFVNTLGLAVFGERMARATAPPSNTDSATPDESVKGVPLPLIYERRRYYPEMLDWVAENIARLVHEEGVPPGEIVVLAPFLSDVLRFSLTNRLERFDVPVRSHRPSRALRDEPATQCLLTLGAFAHPEWQIQPTAFDLAYSLLQAISGLDLVRAQLIAQIVHRPSAEGFWLASFDQINPQVQARITYTFGERYEHLRLWLAEYSQGVRGPFDHFLSRLFGELLSQPGFGFHLDDHAAGITANLIESVQKFRWVAGDRLAEEGITLGAEYLRMVQAGVIAAQYVRSWQLESDDAVLLAPAYTFLMSNRPVDYQFWLDISGRGWYERIYQPLTHPYVLSRHWPVGRLWTDEDEIRTSRQALHRLTLGLIRRCRGSIYLGLSDLTEQGYEGRGELLRAIDRALRGWQEVGVEV